MEITGYTNYLIYDDGRVYSKKRNKFLKPTLSRKKIGYLKLSLCDNNKKTNFTIHRLVALHYIPNPQNKPEVDHINSIRTDNRLESY